MTELKRTHAALQMKNEQLSSFVYTVSHDLKAPLRGISGYTEELLESHRSGLKERSIFCLEKIHLATKKLNALIEDLLHYSKLETVRMDLKLTPIQKLIESLIADQEKSLLNKDTEFSLEIPFFTLRCWELGMKQVFTNLIGNAIKYSGQSNLPQIKIGSSWK
ncbi:MAG TPA: histidine kinase dimerization/phospho-acceptor domain-containing protein [Nitrospiria bacterium]